MLRNTVFAIVAACSVLFTAPVQTAEPRVFRAGAATSNITPRIGEPIVGGFAPVPSTNIHDELLARCLVLDDGETRIGIVICDNVGIAREVCDEAKKLAQAATKIPADRILIAATHTHSASPTRVEVVPGTEPQIGDYGRLVIQRIADGLIRATNNLEPAKIGWGVAREPKHLFNRRWLMQPGPELDNPFGVVDKVRMNPPGGSPRLIKPAGPIDPEISFIAVQSLDGKPRVLLANYSLHYVGGTRSGDISADYFALFADRIQQRLGADRLAPPFVGMLSNGTSGDVNNNNYGQPVPGLPPYEKMQLVADDIAAAVHMAYSSIEFRDWVKLGMIQRELTLATRRPTPEMVAWAEKLTAGELPSKHSLDVIYAKRALGLHRGPAEVTIILQALRIGDLAVVTSPFETFTETGLELKQRSPNKPTFTIELANGSNGYLPTPEQHLLGGYETWLGTSRVEVDASRKMTELLLSMLAELAQAP